ncbi:hypothetical protein NO108_02823 [Planktothrix rubescens]|nr:hypothetical protein NO108_02823 [Planktothrix rubescens]
MSQEIKIAMLGAKGVGKTSLLTAMYDQFENTVGTTNLQLIPDLKSSARLQEKLGQLKSLLDDFEATGGLQGDTDFTSYTFNFGKKGSKPSMSLKFEDYKGGYLGGKNISDQEKIQDILNKSGILLIVIDTPALIEKKGRYHDLINRPQQIKDFIARAFQELKEPRLIIFVPIKCETYLKNEQSKKELLRRVREGYSTLLGFLNSDLVYPWVASVITPVQTVGTVVFSDMDVIKEGGKEYPHFKFHKIYHDAQYSPKDSEQPFRYILRFLLKLELYNRDYHWGPFRFIRAFFNLDKDLKQAAQKVAENCKSNPKDGFVVLQGEKYL